MIQQIYSIVCRKLFDVEDAAPGWRIADVGVGPGHDPIVMLCLGDRFRSSNWQMAMLHDGRSYLSSMAEDGEGFRTLRPFIHGTWLYYRSRGLGRRPDVNVVAEDGREVRDFPFDAQVNDFAVTTEGDVWSWYPDFVVYSGRHLSRSGLCCLDADGATLYHHNDAVMDANVSSHPKTRTYFIGDCYAANLVSDREIWAHWHPKFPLARIIDYRLDEFWTGFSFRGAHGFAVDTGRALFTGGYHETHLYFVDLPTMDTVRLQPIDENQQPVLYGCHYSKGQADTLYLVNEQTIHVVTVAAAVAVVAW